MTIQFIQMASLLRLPAEVQEEICNNINGLENVYVL